MSKKYYPSGYQIIEIDTDKVDGHSYLEVTPDVKTLLHLFKTKQIGRKPLLFHIIGGGTDYTLWGKIDAHNNDIYIEEVVYEPDFSVTSGWQISLHYYEEDEKIQYTIVEL